MMFAADSEGGSAAGVPASWSVAYVAAQAGVLGIAGVALLLATWQSPILGALLDAVTAPIPWAWIPLHILIPLVLPFAVGVPLVFTRFRAPLLLWLGIFSIVVVLAVLEVARLNWAAFLTGVAFRVETGPVPFWRSAAGLVVVLSGVLLMGQQSVHHHVAILRERGVPRPEIAMVRRRLLARERAVVALAAGMGVVLLLVAGFSMGLTERAPAEDPSWAPVLVWVLVLLAGLGGVLAYLVRRRAA